MSNTDNSNGKPRCGNDECISPYCGYVAHPTDTTATQDTEQSILHDFALGIRQYSLGIGKASDYPEQVEVAKSRMEALIDAAMVRELQSLPTLKWDGHEHCIDPHEVSDRIAARSATESKDG